MAETHRFKCAVKGVVVHAGKVLLIQRSEAANGDHGYWELPGGRLEFGESPGAALLREVKEETGLNVAIVGPLSTWTFNKSDTVQVIGITSLCRAEKSTVRLSAEHTQHAWVLPDGIPQYHIVPGMAAETCHWDWQDILARASD